ncbi:hypothetical protein ACLKMH_02060 [Psychromonas sp. KJ10-10]|uniref:[protein-PII] uridylyltransferase family protein n=1 Tax=Psychromonas sp. KJ10-10 TaxID=3391823 RepID=UPI0039B4C705
MRKKMREYLCHADKGLFDLKQSPGGMVDIEFIAQYLVLAYAFESDACLCQWSDNLRIFEACKNQKLLTNKQQQSLVKAYCAIRDATHRLTLNKQKRIVDEVKFEQERQAVIEVWKQFLSE